MLNSSVERLWTTMLRVTSSIPSLGALHWIFSLVIFPWSEMWWHFQKIISVRLAHIVDYFTIGKTVRIWACHPGLQPLKMQGAVHILCYPSRERESKPLLTSYMNCLVSKESMEKFSKGYRVCRKKTLNVGCKQAIFSRLLWRNDFLSAHSVGLGKIFPYPPWKQGSSYMKLKKSYHWY